MFSIWPSIMARSACSSRSMAVICTWFSSTTPIMPMMLRVPMSRAKIMSFPCTFAILFCAVAVLFCCVVAFLFCVLPFLACTLAIAALLYHLSQLSVLLMIFFYSANIIVKICGIVNLFPPEGSIDRSKKIRYTFLAGDKGVFDVFASVFLRVYQLTEAERGGNEMEAFDRIDVVVQIDPML